MLSFAKRFSACLLLNTLLLPIVYAQTSAPHPSLTVNAVNHTSCVCDFQT